MYGHFKIHFVNKVCILYESCDIDTARSKYCWSIMFKL